MRLELVTNAVVPLFLAINPDMRFCSLGFGDFARTAREPGHEGRGTSEAFRWTRIKPADLVSQRLDRAGPQFPA